MLDPESQKIVDDLDRLFRPGVPEQLDRLIRKYACTFTVDLIHRWRETADRKSDEQVFRELQAFRKDLHSLAVGGTLIEHFKNTEATFPSGGLTTVNNLRMLSESILQKLLPSVADGDAATKSREARRMEGMPLHELGGFVRQLREDKAELLMYELKSERLPKDVAAFAYELICTSLLKNSFVLQMACVAIRPHPLSEDDLLIDGLEQANQALLGNLLIGDQDVVLSRILAMKDAADKARRFCASSANDGGEPPEVARPTVVGRLPKLLVTMPGPWDFVYAQMMEHFEDGSCPELVPERAQWEWLTRGAHYVMIFPTWLQYNAASSRLKHLIRRLLVLTHSFREGDAHYVVGKNDSHSVAVVAQTPAKCRALTIPVSAPNPYPQYNPPVIEELCGDKIQTCEFDIAGHPFLTQEDLNVLDRAGLAKAWKWLMEDCSEQGENARRAIEFFDAACSLGGARGAIATEAEESWRLIALRTALEVLFPKQERTDGNSAIDEGVRQSLKQIALPQNQIVRHTEITWRLHHPRNAFIHAGHTKLKSGQLKEALETSRLVLRGQLLHRAQQPAKLYDG